MTASEPTRFFHVCPIMLSVGSVIAPGNFGRVIEQYRRDTLNVMAHRELCFEIIRLRHFPARPSRMTCVFMFASKAAALQHVQRFCPTSMIYEVEQAEQDAPAPFHGDMGIFSTDLPDPSFPILVYSMGLAAQYWIGRTDAPDDDSEFLSESPIRVIGVHDPRIAVSELPGFSAS